MHYWFKSNSDFDEFCSIGLRITPAFCTLDTRQSDRDTMCRVCHTGSFLWFCVPGVSVVSAHGHDRSEPNMCAIPMSLNKNSLKFADQKGTTRSQDK